MNTRTRNILLLIIIATLATSTLACELDNWDGMDRTDIVPTPTMGPAWTPTPVPPGVIPGHTPQPTGGDTP